MGTKSRSVQIIISLLSLNHVYGHKIHNNVVDAQNGVTTESIEEAARLTGCKYVSLAINETVLYKKDTGKLEHTVMARLSDETPADQKPTFEMNFAVKSSSDFRILMFTRQHYTRSHSDRDYEVALGTHNNEFSYFFYTATSESYHNVQFYDLKNSSQILSSSEYRKFYIRINNGILKYGKHCEHEPICSTDNLGLYRPEIVQIGFQSKSEDGAKILYDCPPGFVGCLLETA